MDEKHRRRVRDYYYCNRERMLAAQKKYREQNKAAISARQKARRARDREQRLAKERERYRQNAARIRARDVARIYGLSQAEIARMLQAQNGLCPICRGSLGRFHIDHCHVTGRVRGLLCRKCNIGIGHLNDDATLLRRAIAYLKRAAMEA